MAARIPPVFISHGSPMLFAETHDPAHRFLADLVRRVGADRPRAIVVVSAHWEETTVSVTSSTAPPQIYDFYGFPRELYSFVYPARGDPALAQRVVQLLQNQGVGARLDPKRGLDHGTWSPLCVAFPKADVPIVQVALQRDLDPAFHIRVGRALAPLQYEGVLIVGSGGATHNLGAIRFQGGGSDMPWAARFDAHLRDVLVNKAGPERERAVEQLLSHPDVDKAHPTKEHLAPVYVVVGAGSDHPARPLYEGMVFGSLSLNSYAF